MKSGKEMIVALITQFKQLWLNQNKTFDALNGIRGLRFVGAMP